MLSWSHSHFPNAETHNLTPVSGLTIIGKIYDTLSYMSNHSRENLCSHPDNKDHVSEAGSGGQPHTLTESS